MNFLFCFAQQCEELIFVSLVKEKIYFCVRIFSPYFCTMSIQIIKEKQVSAAKVPVSYAQVATVPSERVNLSLKEIQACYSMLSVNGGDIHISSPQEVCQYLFIRMLKAVKNDHCLQSLQSSHKGNCFY